jgi:thiol-disulfide isomerase/thioredoxin
MDNGKDTPPRRPWLRLSNLLLILAAFAVIHWWRTEPLASGDAPPLKGRLVAGDKVFDLAQLRGRPSLVHFWASWCPVCKLGDEAIDSIARDFPVITVAMQSGDPSDILAHLRKEGLSFPVIPDPYGELASAWGVQGVPATFVLDGNGEIRFATMGYTTEVGLRGRLWAATALE